MAKTFIYAFLYGAGAEKIGSIIGKGRQAGNTIKRSFLKKLPALKKLIDGVKARAELAGALRGLDGRSIHIRSSHSALNFLLQSAGAIVCKQWIVEFERLLVKHNLKHLVGIMAWVHDELQMSVDLSLVTYDIEGKASSIVGDLCIQAIAKAGEVLGIRVPLTGEYKIGLNWKDCH